MSAIARLCKPDIRVGLRVFFAPALISVLLFMPLATISAAGDDLLIKSGPGQTLQMIVERELLSGRFLSAIADYNQIADPVAELAPGTQIRLPTPYLPLKNFGRIVFCKGDVSHLQRGHVLVNPPAIGSFVYVGDEFKTGSSGFCTIQFSGDARTSIQPKTQVNIKTIECADDSEPCSIGLFSEYGDLKHEITPPSEDALPVKYTVETPHISAAVRGTAFYTSSENAVSRLGVTRGEVGAASGNSEFDVAPGQGVMAGANIVPEAVELLPAPDYANVSENGLISREDSFYWQELDDAVAYKVVVARDKALTHPFSTGQTILPRWRPLAEPGDYYVGVVGLDNREFAGLPAVRKIRFAEVAVPQPPELALIKNGEQLRIASVSELSGPLQLSLSNSLEAGAAYEHRIFDIGSGDEIVINLDPTLNWSIRARTVVGEFAVSAYTDSYYFAAQ